MKNIVKYLIKGIYAGLMIGIGGTVYLMCEDKVIGSFLFAIGLLTICMYGMNLYTGKVGYVLVNKISYGIELVMSLIGNYIGANCVGLLMNICNKDMVNKAVIISNMKINNNLLNIFILSIFCGILMYIAVNNFKNSKDIFSKYIGIFLCVMVFILSGFEHCVANMFYFSVSHIYTLKSLLYLLIMILGNSVGSIIIAFYYNLYFKNKE